MTAPGTREQWLALMVDALRDDFHVIGCPVPDKVRVSCGWPSRSALGTGKRRIGEAWSPRSSADGTHETFLSPCLADPIEVGAVLVHELVHHAVGCEHGHKGPFRKVALAMGLAGKMTATVASDALRQRLHAIVERIGPYPHAKLDGASGRKKQGTRMLKVACPACGCLCRMTRQWLDDAGAPQCACGERMAEA